MARESVGLSRNPEVSFEQLTNGSDKVLQVVPVGPQDSVVASSGTVANAVAAATIPAAAGKLAYVTGFVVTGSGATAASVVTVTLAGLLGGTAHFTLVAEAGATTQNTNLTIQFQTPLPASAVNTAITLSCPALGAGNTNNTAVIYGFYI